MIDITYLLTIAVTAAATGWYCYRWGRTDGRSEGYADGLSDGSDGRPGPTPNGGGGPKEPA